MAYYLCCYDWLINKRIIFPTPSGSTIETFEYEFLGKKRRVKASILCESSNWKWQALFIKLVVVRVQATFKCSKGSWILLWKEFNLASWHRWDYQYLFFSSNYSVVLKWVVESGRTWDRNLMISEFILACTKFNQIGVFVVFMFLFECVHVRVCFVKTFAQHSSS